MMRRISRERGLYGFLSRPQLLKVLPPFTMSIRGTKLLALESLNKHSEM